MRQKRFVVFDCVEDFSGNILADTVRYVRGSTKSRLATTKNPALKSMESAAQEVDAASILSAFCDKSISTAPGVYQRRGGITEELKINKMPLQNARAAGLFGDDAAPDACQKKSCRGGRGYIVSHIGGSAETLVKLLLTQTTISVMKFVQPVQRKRTRAAVVAAAAADAPPSGWLPLPLLEIKTRKQLRETLSWM